MVVDTVVVVVVVVVVVGDTEGDMAAAPASRGYL